MDVDQGKQLARAYIGGATIRDLAAMCGQSYRQVRTQLMVSQVEFRRRGGDTRSPAARAAHASAIRPRQAGLRRARSQRLEGRAANPQAGRPRPDRTMPPASWAPPGPDATTVSAEALRLQLIDSLERSTRPERQTALAAMDLDDDQVWLAMQQLPASVDDAFAPRRDS